MGATIAGFGIERGELFLPDQGVWSAELVPFDDAVLVVGDRVELVVGDLTLSGTVVGGGVFESKPGVLVVGGAGGWRKDIALRAYRDDANGVRLSGILADLATDTGETVELASSLEGVVVGAAWTRPDGVAAEALDVLGYPWRVRPDGVTEVGPVVESRPGGIVSLRRWMAARRTAIVELPDEEVASLVPGAVLELADDVTLAVRSAAITITPDTLRGRLVGA